MNVTGQVLVFDTDTGRAPELFEQLEQRGLKPIGMEPSLGGNRARRLQADLAIVLLNEVEERSRDAVKLLQRLADDRLATLAWPTGEGVHKDYGPIVEWLDPGIGLEEVLGKTTTLARYGPLVRGFERELTHMSRLGEQLNRYFGEIDQEMRLAGRLQRDFLPRKFPTLPPYAFHSIYRPASWVSGDMYDVFRIDEHHLGMFLADAMGHGVAAGLLTMFLRQALVSKQIDGDRYVILRPPESLQHLHQVLVRQHLPNCQFVTAAYGVVDMRSRKLTLARAGHPYPLLLRSSGEIREIRSEGSLLGLPEVPAEFDEITVDLEPGDKVLMYTDGMEDVILKPNAGEGEVGISDELRAWTQQHGDDFPRAIEDHLDAQAGSLHPSDDVTVLAMEVSQDA